MREWFGCGIALLCGSGLLAMMDGYLQLGHPESLLQPEMMGFAVLSAWALCFPLWLFWAVLRHPLAHAQGSAFWAGIALASCPIFQAWVPQPLHFLGALGVFGLALLPPMQRFAPPASARLLLTLGLGFFLLSSVFLPQSSPSLSPDHYHADADPRPIPTGIDVFLISVDTLRADALVDDPHTRGDSTSRTPFLQQQRTQSLWADYAFSSSNQTLPGHVGMLSGCDAMQHGVRSNSDIPDPNLALLAEIFQDAGWHTTGVISNALLSAATGMNRGYDTYSDAPIGMGAYAVMLAPYLHAHTWAGFLFSAETTRTLFQRIFFRNQQQLKAIPLADRVSEVALLQLKANYANPRPFFHFMHFMDPHTAYRPPASVRGSLSAELAPQVATKFLASIDSEISVEMVRQVQTALQAQDPDAPLAARYYHQVYLEEMAYVDQQLQRIFAVANASGRPYVTLFTADHGEQFGEHQMMDHANSLYQKNIQVPFQLWGTGVIPGHLTTHPHSADVAPTLLELAGLTIPDTMTGQVVNIHLPPRAHVVVDQKRISVMNAEGLQWTGSWPQSPNVEPEDVRLLDLRVDPTETSNLFTDPSSVPKNLRHLIDTFLDRDTWHIRQTGAHRSEAQDAALNGMGYANQIDERP